MAISAHDYLQALRLRAALTRTFLREVRRLLPGHYLIYEAGRAVVHRYWRPAFPDHADLDRRTSEGEWAELTRKHVDALALAEACVKAWRDFFKAHDIAVPD